jgi:hypothetical protein
MNVHRVLTAVENLRVVDRPAAAIATAVRRVLKAPKVDRALRGSWLGHPLHPLMVTVPIGAWVAAAVLDTRKANQDAARSLIEVHQPLGGVDEHGHPVPLPYQAAPVPKKMNKLGAAGKPVPGTLLRPDPPEQSKALEQARKHQNPGNGKHNGATEKP